MNTFMRRAGELLRTEDGPTTTEYAVMLALIIFICIAAITGIGSTTEGIFTNLDNEITGTGAPGA